MYFTGNTIRYHTCIQSGSFEFRNIKTNALEYISGSTPQGKEMQVGFTGTSGEVSWYFSFRNGRIYDPEGRWFASYDENTYTTISGDFTTGNYTYYLNGSIINAVGLKIDNDFNGWFVNCVSGASGQGSIYVSTNTISTELYMQSGFYEQGIWSGSFHNSHSRPLVIRSGELLLPDAVYFEITGTGLSFNSGTNVVPSDGYRTITLNHLDTGTVTGVYTINVRVYTDFGYADFEVSGSGVPYNNGFYYHAISPETGYNIVSPVTGTGLFDYWYSATRETISGTRLTKPFIIMLQHESGFTGVHSVVTGFSITDGGAGYTANTYFYSYPASQAWPAASGQGLIDGGGTITGFSGFSTGVITGATGSCYVEVDYESDGGGTFDLLWSPTQYTKTYDAFVTGWTGELGADGAACTGTIGSMYGSGTLPTGTDFMYCSVTFLGTPDNLALEYKIIFSGLPDSTSGISMFTGTGLLYTSG